MVTSLSLMGIEDHLHKIGAMCGRPQLSLWLGSKQIHVHREPLPPFPHAFCVSSSKRKTGR